MSPVRPPRPCVRPGCSGLAYSGHVCKRHAAEDTVVRLPKLPRPAVPVVVVCGPPGSGKSTFVEERAASTDIVIDLDAIRAELAGGSSHDDLREWTGDALIERNHRLRALSQAPADATAWFIVSAPTAEERQWWSDQLHGSVVVLSVSESVCANRIQGDARRIGRVAEYEAAARSWWARYSPRAGDRVTTA